MKRLNPNLSGSRHHADLKSLHQKSGVYLLLVNRVLYVGSSCDLRARLRSWAYRHPGALYTVKLCADYRAQEQKMIEKLRAQSLRLANKVNAVKPVRELKTRMKNPKPPGPGRTPPRMIAGRSLTEWCARNKITKGLFYARLSQGWTPEEAIQPKRR